MSPDSQRLDLLVSSLSQAYLSRVRAHPHEGRREVEALVELLCQSSEPWIRFSAARHLARLGPACHFALPVLVSRLGDLGSCSTEDLGPCQVSEAVERVLVEVGEETLPYLERGLREEPPATRVRILEVAEQFPSGRPILLLALGDPEASVRIAAAQRLDVERLEERQGLLSALEDDEAEVALYAATALTDGFRSRSTSSDLRQELQQALPTSWLMQSLRSPDPNRRQVAALTLRFAPPDSRPARALLEALDDSDARVRYAAAHSLPWRGPELDAAGVSKLCALVGEKRHTNYQEPMLWSLLPYGEAAAPVGEACLRMIEEGVWAPALARAAAHVVGGLGPAAAPLLPQLENLVLAGNDYARLAWSKLGPAALSQLPRLLDSLQGPSALFAAQALEALGVDSTPAIDALRRVVERGPSAEWPVVAASVKALGRIGPPAAAAAPALAALLEPGAPHYIYLAVLSALSQMGPPAASAAPGVLRFLERQESGVPYETQVQYLARAALESIA